MGLLGGFGKKSGSMKKLTEEEIQKRLYGNYHGRSGSATETEAPSPAVPPKASLPTLESGRSFAAPAGRDPAPGLFDSPRKEPPKVVISQPAASRPPEPYYKKPSSSPAAAIPQPIARTGNFWDGWIEGLLRLVTTRRRHAARIAVWCLSIAGIALLFWGVHYLNVQREKAMSTSSGLSKKTAAKPSQQNAPSAETAVPVATTFESSEGVLTPVEGAKTQGTAAPAQRTFVIQIATYVNETDARPLVEKLKAAGFTAFMRRESSGERKYHTVYLGRFSTFQMGQEKLHQFRQTEFSKTFQDAFVRSITE
ncbi:MAG: SPOR domain-containing protein [Candidatus Omnitrophota bacterium]